MKNSVFINPGCKRPCPPSLFFSLFLLPFCHSLVFAASLQSFSSVPLVYHAIMVVVRDGGEYSGYRNSHRSARPQSTPKPADSRQKIKERQKKSKPSALFFPLHPSCYHNHQQYRSLLHSLVPVPCPPSYLPFSISPFSLPTTLTLYQKWLSPVFALLFSFFFHPKIPFTNSLSHLSYFHLPPIYLSPSLSLHLLLSASLCTSIALCTLTQMIKHTQVQGGTLGSIPLQTHQPPKSNFQVKRKGIDWFTFAASTVMYENSL